MAYDNSKDVLIKSFQKVDEQDESKIIFANIYSYDGGAKKISLSRSYMKGNELQTNGKIGRMSIEEIKWLNENLDDIITLMEQ